MEEDLKYILFQLNENLRDILSNIKEEQKAIFWGELTLIENIISKRLDLLDKNDKIFYNLLDCVFLYSDLKKIPPPNKSDLSLNSILKWLYLKIDLEEIEMRFWLENLINVLDELHNQNKLTKNSLNSKLLFDREINYNYHQKDPQHLKKEKPKQKITLKTIERPDL